MDKSQLNLSNSSIYKDHEKLIAQLELEEDFAVRLGETDLKGWKLGNKATKNLGKRPLEPHDLVPNVSQKGVDLRIGLDIARLALTKIVDIIVVTTGDSDFIPAFKFARREGIRVFLDHMGHGVKRELKVHTDKVI